MKKNCKDIELLEMSNGMHGFEFELSRVDTDKEEELRKLSNIIQALENLIVQCSDYRPFDHVREFGLQTLYLSKQRLQQKIHE